VSAVRPFSAPDVWKRARSALDSSRATILVVCDLDGTLAPIVTRPDRARVPARTIRLLNRAARAPRLRVAVLSARPLRDMRRLVPVPGILFVGQYGLEGPLAPTSARRERLRRGCRRLAVKLRRAAESVPGARIESKGLTVAVHDRAVSPRSLPTLRRLVRRIEAGAASREGFITIPGRRVIDFVPRGFDKGRVMKRLRAAFRPGVVFYFGDSPGDDSAFAALSGQDFPVRVGRGATRAKYRVAKLRGVPRFLEALAESRNNASSHKEVAPCA